MKNSCIETADRLTAELVDLNTRLAAADRSARTLGARRDLVRAHERERALQHHPAGRELVDRSAELEAAESELRALGAEQGDLTARRQQAQADLDALTNGPDALKLAQGQLQRIRAAGADLVKTAAELRTRLDQAENRLAAEAAELAALGDKLDQAIDPDTLDKLESQRTARLRTCALAEKLVVNLKGELEARGGDLQRHRAQLDQAERAVWRAAHRQKTGDLGAELGKAALASYVAGYRAGHPVGDLAGFVAALVADAEGIVLAGFDQAAAALAADLGLVA